jgi:glycosyltransferase 2 family protein
VQTYLLCVAAGYSDVRTAVAALGASAFAICVGVLAVPFPAGAGVRETAFVLALSATVPSAVALLVAIAARLTLVVVDLGAAGVSAAWGRAVDRRPPVPSPSDDAASAGRRTG